MARDAIAIMTALVTGTTTAAVTGRGSNTAIVASVGTIALTTHDFGRLMGVRTGGRFKTVSANRTGATEPELALNADVRIAKTWADGDVGDQIAGFFDGGQIDPGSSETRASRGYSC
jgi:hypothetical protein